MTPQVSPLRNAIETMEGSNRTLRDLIVAHRSDPSLQLNPLSMKINGIVDAAVMGGITNYEKAFFQPEYAETHADDAASIDRLKDLIASQIPLLEVAIQLHRQRAPVSLGPFQQRLEECFSDMQTHVEHNYGKKSTDLKLDTPHSVTMRRQFSGVTGNLDHRLSEVSLASSEGNRSRVSSLTRSQVATLKNFATNFNFANLNANAALGRASSAQGASNPGGKSHGTPPTSLATRSATMFSKSSSVGGAKRNKDKRRSSRGKAERDSNPQTLAVTPTTTTPTTQWYMASPLPADTDRITWAVGTPVFELRQELTPKRPLRSEVERERRLSRPSCGQFPPTRLSSTGANTTTARFNGSSSNRDSIGTTDSTASEEDGAPPPLPQKTREADYCNLPDDAERESESIRAPATPRIRNKPPPPPEPLEGPTPPHPPPKKPPLKPSTS